MPVGLGNPREEGGGKEQGRGREEGRQKGGTLGLLWFVCLLVCLFVRLFVCSPTVLPKTHIVGKTSSGIDVAQGAGKGRKVAFPHWHLSLYFFSSKVTPCDFGSGEKS